MSGWGIFLVVWFSLGVIISAVKGIAGKGDGATFISFIMGLLILYAVLQIEGVV